MDYEPIDISFWCSAGAELLPGENPMLGEQTMRGLPFTVGAPGGDPSGKCYISLAEGDASVAVPVSKTVQSRVCVFALSYSRTGRWRPSRTPTAPSGSRRGLRNPVRGLGDRHHAHT